MKHKMTGEDTIDTENRNELKFWAVELRVTMHELLDTINKIGTCAVSKVEEHIRTVKYY